MNRLSDPEGPVAAHSNGRRRLSCLCRVKRRYDRVAPFYEAAMVVERLFFPQARRRAVELLRLEPGQTVVDIGSGSGRNLPLLREAVGEGGEIIAVDWSPRMLDAARDRANRNGWSNVRFLRADAATLTPEGMARWSRRDASRRGGCRVVHLRPLGDTSVGTTYEDDRAGETGRTGGRRRCRALVTADAGPDAGSGPGGP